MALQQLFLIGFFSLALLQPNGCSSKSLDQTNQTNKTSATPTSTPKIGSEEGDQDKMEILKQKVLKKEQRAVNMAEEMGKTAIPVLKPLAKDADADVRKLALNCLRYTGGGEDINEIFIEALKDDSPNVNAEAARGLQHASDPSIYAPLLEVYDDVSNPERRRDIALMLGKIDGAKVDDLRLKSEEEKSAEAKEGLMVAMAKVGDQKSKDEFISVLHSAKNQELKRFLGYVEYISKIWAVKALAPILTDKTPLVYIGVDGIKDGASDLRACDIAVNIIYKIMTPKLSFAVKGDKNYSDGELDQIKGYLMTLQQ